MSRFENEWAVVPDGARWSAVLVCLVVTALMAGVFLVPGFTGRGVAPARLVPLLFASLLGVAFLGGYVLLVGYVWGDAKRRGMNHVLWTLLAIFIPNAIGIILYFILRDPVPVPCPSCGTLARKGHAYCASCGAVVRAACPQCRQPVEPGWHNCARCGAPIAAPIAPGTAAAP
jgi:Double zinc ribbon